MCCVRREGESRRGHFLFRHRRKRDSTRRPPCAAPKEAGNPPRARPANPPTHPYRGRPSPTAAPEAGGGAAGPRARADQHGAPRRMEPTRARGAKPRGGAACHASPRQGTPSQAGRGPTRAGSRGGAGQDAGTAVKRRRRPSRPRRKTDKVKATPTRHGGGTSGPTHGGRGGHASGGPQSAPASHGEAHRGGHRGRRGNAHQGRAHPAGARGPPARLKALQAARAQSSPDGGRARGARSQRLRHRRVTVLRPHEGVERPTPSWLASPALRISPTFFFRQEFRAALTLSRDPCQPVPEGGTEKGRPDCTGAIAP